MSIVRILRWMLASLLGAAVALWSFAVSNETRNPTAVAALADIPGLPVAVARDGVALRLYAARRDSDPGAKVNKTERDLAHYSYRKEPLLASSVGLLAMSSGEGISASTRESLLEQAGRLTRRNSLVAINLIESAALRGDDRAFFAWLSRLMLTKESARQTYGTAMAKATARDGAVEALLPVLGSKPPWADQYWRLIAGNRDSLVNGAELRIELSRAPWLQTRVTPADDVLTRALVNAGQFQTAKRIAAALQPRLIKQADNILRNGNFTAAPVLPPFDWQLTGSGSLGSSIDARQKNLRISAIPGARGAAARQLLRLEPGKYALGWSASSDEPFAADVLSLRFVCASPASGSSAPISLPLTMGKQQRASIHIAGSCRWYWLSIDAAVPDDSAGIDAYVHNLSISMAKPLS